MGSNGTPGAAEETRGWGAVALTVLAGAIGAALVLLIRAYQATLGPLLGGRCRFVPSCSEYAVQALRERGPVVGMYLTARRLVRCHPLGGHGFDPVPAPKGRAAGVRDEATAPAAHDSAC